MRGLDPSPDGWCGTNWIEPRRNPWLRVVRNGGRVGFTFKKKGRKGVNPIITILRRVVEAVKDVGFQGPDE